MMSRLVVAERRFGRARLRVLIALFILAAGAAAASLWVHAQGAQQRAVELMVAAQEARTDVPALGTVVIRSPGLDGPEGVRAQVHRGAGRAAIHYLDGPARDAWVFREGGRVWRGGGRATRPLALEADADMQRLDPDLLARNYVARVMGNEEIAGRPAVHLALRRRHAGGGLHMWLDRDTHFPLRTVITDHAGRAVSDTAYETIDYRVGPPTMPPPPEGAREPGFSVRPTTPEEAAREAGFRPLQPSYLPRGFEPAGWHLHRFRGGRGPAVALRCTDGLAGLSVIQMKTADRRGGPGKRRGAGPGAEKHPHRPGAAPGPDRPHVPRRLDAPPAGKGGKALREHGDITVIVIGELPQDELQRVADSVG